MFDRASALWRKLTHQPVPIRPAAQAVEDDRRVWVRRHVSIDTRVTPASGEGEPSLSATSWTCRPAASNWPRPGPSGRATC